MAKQPKPVSARKLSVLFTETFEGVPGGMNLALPAHEVPDTQAHYLQDIILDQAGMTYRRGPLSTAPGVATFSNPIFGIAEGSNPQGTVRVAVLEGNNSNAYLSVLSSPLDSATQVPWFGTFPTSPYYIVDAKPRMGGGAIIGSSKQYEAGSPVQALGIWRGADKTNYSTGTITVSQGGTTVTGSGTSWSTNAASGMFLMNGSGQLIGVVKSVDSNTQLTLEQSALLAVSASSYTLQSVIGMNPRVMVGRITTSTVNATVTGQNTKFSDNGLGSGTWDIYKYNGLTYIGTVSSVTDNLSLTLSSNAAVNTNAESYVAIKRTGNYSLDTTADSRKVGFLTAVYAGRQWYANRANGDEISRVWFSQESEPEAIDLSPTDGDFLPISSGTPQSASAPIKAIIPAYNSLLILKENETFALFGATPEQFEVRKINDDGCLSGMTALPYEGGVFYAGRNGIYYYDGAEANNYTLGSLGQYYKHAITSFDPTTHRMWATIIRDHYLLFIESVTPTVGITKGNTTTTPTRLTIAMYIPTKSITLWTNVNLRGGITLPASTNQNPWVLVNTATGGRICDASVFFDGTGLDSFACDGDVAGPDFYFESKRYAVGDSVRKKLFKQLMMHYQSAGDSLKLDTVPGLNNAGATATSNFPRSAYTWDELASAYSSWDTLSASYPNWDSITETVWYTKRIKFLKRDHFFAFRIYQNSSSNTAVKLGPFQLGFKYQRAGRP